MPILSPIQRRSAGGRILLGTMYVLLSIGSVWMVYPFLLMLSGSIKSEVDIRQFDIIPRYLYDDAALFRKYLEQRYWGNLDNFQSATRYRDEQGRAAYSFEFLEPPAPVEPAVLDDWRAFFSGARSWPKQFCWIANGSSARQIGELTMQYHHRLYAAFPDANRTELAVELPPESWISREFIYVSGPFAPTYKTMRAELPLRYLIPVSVEGNYATFHLMGSYGIGDRGVAKLNAKWGMQLKSMAAITMPATPPVNPAERADWWAYVQKTLSARFIRLDAALLPRFRDYLAAQYRTIKTLNEVYLASYTDWAQVEFPGDDAPSGAFADIQTFLQSLPGPEGIRIDAVDFRWRQFLREKYQDDLAALNRAHATRYTSFNQLPMPILANDWATMKEHRRSVARELAARNYRIVLDYLSHQGRAFRNTILFCLLNVVTALIVNPLAAYALSRFQPRWGYAALFVMMATMAFPAEVTQIPAFLMLRQLGLLNTFAALVIPAAANGYSIFLLKGFFDSLPKELYESATIDGASELRIFGNITLALSTPILAVIALGAFTAAYGAFMFALLVCQDQKMWTVMVYIYQLQESFGTPVIFAALVLAAIPTLLVFVFCQNIIMRGIVVPVEK